MEWDTSVLVFPMISAAGIFSRDTQFLTSYPNIRSFTHDVTENSQSLLLSKASAHNFWMRRYAHEYMRIKNYPSIIE